MAQRVMWACAVPVSDGLSPGRAPQVAKANDYVNQGNKALGQAKELQKDTRKWMCCAMMLLLGICLIVVLAVVKPWQVRIPGSCHACACGRPELVAWLLTPARHTERHCLSGPCPRLRRRAHTTRARPGQAGLLGRPPPE